jgi:hypothetical protein
MIAVPIPIEEVCRMNRRLSVRRRSDNLGGKREAYDGHRVSGSGLNPEGWAASGRRIDLRGRSRIPAPSQRLSPGSRQLGR